MATAKDPRFVSRIEATTQARHAGDFGWSEYHTGSLWTLIVWMGESFDTHSAFVSTGEKQVFINSMRQPLRVRREVPVEDISRFDSHLFDVFYGCRHAAQRPDATLRGPDPFEHWLLCKAANEVAAEHHKLRFEAPPNPSLTSNERDQLMLLLRKAHRSGHLSDELLVNLRTLSFDAHLEHEAKNASERLQTVSPDERDPGLKPSTVLEIFDGFVERIEGETAYVTLQSRLNGDMEEGTYSASKLAEMGIHEQSFFVFKSVDVGDAIRPVFEPVPQEPLAADVVQKIDAKIDQLLPHEDPGIKY